MVEKETVRSAYDELAGVYADHRSAITPGVEILGAFLASLDDPARILDAGCGQGSPVLERLDRETAAVGVDVSREQLRLADATVPGAGLAQGDIASLPFADGAFDAVVAYWSLIHVPMDEHPRAVREFARVLRPGGRVLLCEGTNSWAGSNPDWLDSGVEMQWHIAGAEATREHLRTAGFEVYETWRTRDTLEEDDEEASRSDDSAGDGATRSDDSANDADLPWTFLAARPGQ